MHIPLKRAKRRLALGVVAFALALTAIGGLSPGDASAMRCWQPDGPGTPFVCTAP